MPTYGYCIESTGEIVEVTHTMALTPVNWGELCLLCSLKPEEIPLETKVTKLLATTGITQTRCLQKADPARCLKSCDGICPSSGC